MTRPPTRSPRAADGWRTAAEIIVGIVAVALGAVLLLVITAIATFFVGPFSLVVPLGTLVAVGIAMTNRKGEAAEWCPECRGVLSIAVVEPVRTADEAAPRLRAVYTCAVLGHRSWRWADAGEPLRLLGVADEVEQAR